ncbi:transposase, partial [Thermodesulfobacteriota bacterium]
TPRGILCCDRFRAYFKAHGGVFQFCWAHLIRNFKELASTCLTEDAQHLSQWMLDEAKRLFHIWHMFTAGDRHCSSRGISGSGPIRARMSACLQKYRKSEIPRVGRFAGNLLLCWDGLFTFLYHEGVEPTNNIAEQAARPPVMWRRICQGNKTEQGAWETERLLTIVTSLLGCPHIAEIYVSTNCPVLMEEIPRNCDRVRIIPRPAHLCADTVSMNDILLHEVDYIEAEWYVQTHATNPLLRTETATRAIEALLDCPQHDPLLSVTPMYTRLWDTGGRPINHDPSVLQRTQDLEPVLEENSNLYIFRAENLRQLKNRIGKRPLTSEITREEAWDIDEEFDFRIAEFLQLQQREALEYDPEKSVAASPHQVLRNDLLRTSLTYSRSLGT